MLDHKQSTENRKKPNSKLHPHHRPSITERDETNFKCTHLFNFLFQTCGPHLSTFRFQRKLATFWRQLHRITLTPIFTLARLRWCLTCWLHVILGRLLCRIYLGSWIQRSEVVRMHATSCGINLTQATKNRELPLHCRWSLQLLIYTHHLLIPWFLLCTRCYSCLIARQHLRRYFYICI